MTHTAALNVLAGVGLTPEQEQALADAGLVIVPRRATKAMCRAASQSMRLRREALGENWHPVSNAVKAGIRWDVMVTAWEAEP